MKSRAVTIFWGVALILVSALLFAEELGYISIGLITREGWTALFGVAAAALLITYFLVGVEQWGWLIPALICAGLAVSAWQLGAYWIGQPITGLLVLLAIAIPLYVGFLLNRARWGLLIPAYLLTGAAFSIAMDEIGRSVDFVQRIRLMQVSSAVELFLVAVPFFVAYFWSKKNWWALIPAIGMLGVTLVTAMQSVIQDEENSMTGVYNAITLLGIAVPCGLLWLRRATVPTDWAKYPAVGLTLLAVGALLLGNRWADITPDARAIGFALVSGAFFVAYFVHGVNKWGWLFPALTSASVAMMMWMDTSDVDGAIVAVPIFVALTVPFLVGFAFNRSQWGLLVAATFLGAFSTFLALVDYLPAGWDGAASMFAFAVPFFAIYLLSKHGWWALIPGGTFATIGVVVLVETLVPHQDYPVPPSSTYWMTWDAMVWVMFLGLAVTFGIVWLRHNTEPTGWAAYPALGLAIMAVLVLVLRERFQAVWLGAMTLVAGAMLLLAALARREAPGGQLPHPRT